MQHSSHHHDIIHIQRSRLLSGCQLFGHGEKLFSRLDSDGDGKVNSDEFTSAMQKRFGGASSSEGTDSSNKLAEIFSKLDSDEDGQLANGVRPSHVASAPDHGRSWSGWTWRPASGCGRIFSRADTDDSGTVTADELETQFENSVLATDPDAKVPDFAKLVEKLDTNGDGSLSESEFAARRPPPPHGGPGGGMKDPAEMFSSMDSDSDGLVSLDEFKADLEAKLTELGSSSSVDVSKLFSSFDNNNDGSITQDEFTSMMDQFQALAGALRSSLLWGRR